MNKCRHWPVALRHSSNSFLSIEVPCTLSTLTSFTYAEIVVAENLHRACAFCVVLFHFISFCLCTGAVDQVN